MKKIVLLFLVFSLLFAGLPKNYHKWDAEIKAASEKYNVDEDIIRTIIMSESSYKDSIAYGKEVSKAGAIGLMQVIPKTAGELGFSVEDLKDPAKNIMAGTKLLHNLRNKSWIGDNNALLFASYNAGPYRQSIKDGFVPAIKETQDYVLKSKKFYEETFHKDFGEVKLAPMDNNGSSGGSGSTSTRKGYYPSVAALNYSNVVHANPSNYCSVINSASPNTMIILDNGNYGGGCNINDASHLTIKGASKKGVVFNTTSSWVFHLVGSKYINFIGYTVKNGNLGKIASVGNHHIYFGDIDVFNGMSPQTCVLYSSANTHDATMDKIKVLRYDGWGGYGWYCQGYHLTVSNCLFINMHVPAVAIRGHYPIGEGISWRNNHINVYTQSHHNIPKNDWTHLIVNNTFAFSHHNGRENMGAVSREAFLVFYAGGNSEGDKEKAVFPPQNVVIENNVFYKAETRGSVTGAIEMGYGFPQGADGSSYKHGNDAVMLGTIIRNNVGDADLERTSHANKSLIRMENNHFNVGASNVGLVNPEGGNFSPRADAKLLINQSAINGNYQPEDIESRPRDQYPDIGAYEGPSNNSVPPPTNLPPTNVPFDTPEVIPMQPGSGLQLTKQPPQDLTGDTCIRDCNSEFVNATSFIEQMILKRYERVEQAILELEKPLREYVNVVKKDFSDNRDLAHDLMKQRTVQVKKEEFLTRKNFKINNVGNNIENETNFISIEQLENFLIEKSFSGK